MLSRARVRTCVGLGDASRYRRQGWRCSALPMWGVHLLLCCVLQVEQEADESGRVIAVNYW